MFSITMYRKTRFTDTLYAGHFRSYNRYIVCKIDVSEDTYVQVQPRDLRKVRHSQNNPRDCSYMHIQIINITDYAGCILCKLFFLCCFLLYFCFIYFNFLLFSILSFLSVILYCFLLFLIIFDLLFLISYFQMFLNFLISIFS